MPRQSLILVVAALGLVALVAGGAWWIAGPTDMPSVVVEPASVEPEAQGDEEPLALVDSSDAGVEERELVPIEALADDAPEAAIAAEAPAHRASVSAQLVDAATSEPLPDYAFDLTDSRRRRVSLLTDAEGRFDAALHAGPLRARFSESSSQWIDVGELRFGSMGEPETLVLRVASGPTYRLAITPRDVVAPEKLQSRLRVRVGKEDVRASGRVRGGPVPWTRLAPIAAAAGSHARLTLESSDGEWRGTAQVVMGPGVRPGVVPVVLDGYCAVDVHVFDPEGRPVPAVDVEMQFGAERRGSQFARTSNEGRAHFGFIGGGTWTLVVRTARFVDLERPVVLRPGVLGREDVQLVRAPSAGAIRGIVLSDTGRYRERVFVSMTRLDQETPGSIGARVEWTEAAGIATGRFEILDVPHGRWRLSVSEDDWFDWEPRRSDVEPPLEGLQLRVHDAVPVVDLVIRPSGEDGAAFQGRYELRMASGPSTHNESRNGEALIPSFPVEQPLRWRIDAADRAPAIGDWSEFVTDPPADGRERRRAQPVLVAGWGELYRVTRSDNRRPVEGAAVLVDGREMGKTDKDGRVYVRAASKPASVTFRYRDWKLDRKIDLNPPRSGSRELERSVRLQPPKRKAKK